MADLDKHVQISHSCALKHMRLRKIPPTRPRHSEWGLDASRIKSNIKTVNKSPYIPLMSYTLR